MTRILLALLAFYSRWISPALHAVSPGRCKFIPTCSEYSAIAIATHRPMRGAALTIWRLIRCHPFSPGGFDPVPPAAGQILLATPSRANCAAAPPAMPREPLP